MKENVMLTIASLLSMLLLTLHLMDDIILGIAPGGVSNMTAVLVLVVWLYGTLVLAGRRSGYVIILLGSIIWSGHPHPPHDGEGSRCRQVHRSLLLRLDAPRARRDRDLLRHPLGARTV